jgi:hypothetical protein
VLGPVEAEEVAQPAHSDNVSIDSDPLATLVPISTRNS